MIYWTTRSIVPSMRFYKENLSGNFDTRVDARYVASWFPYQKQLQLFSVPKDNTSPFPPLAVLVCLYPPALLPSQKSWYTVQSLGQIPSITTSTPTLWCLEVVTLLPLRNPSCSLKTSSSLSERLRSAEPAVALRPEELLQHGRFFISYFKALRKSNALMLAKTTDEWCWHILNCDLNKMKKYIVVHLSLVLFLKSWKK